MKILKRNGNYQSLSFDKILFRLQKLCNDESLGKLLRVDTDIIAQRVISGMYDGVSSIELDEEAARTAIGITDNLEYSQLASRIIISNMHKSTNQKFSEVMEALYTNLDKNGNPAPILSDIFIEHVRKNAEILDNYIDYSRDYSFDYFGYKRLENGYLMKIYNNNLNKFEIVERPQHLYMRVAVAIHRDDLDSIFKTYTYLSQHYYTHATPSLFNSGNRLGNLSSCFHEDTIVATVNRGPVKIKDVLIGDSVITHLGNVKKVTQLHKNLLNDRSFIDLKIYKTKNIKVTDNHKLWACTKEFQPKWISVEDLNVGDYVSVPNGSGNKKDYIIDLLDYKDLIIGKRLESIEYKVEYTEDKIILYSFFQRKSKNQHTINLENHKDTYTTQKIIHNEINRFIKIDSDFARFLGIWYGDGCIFTNTDNKKKERQIRGIGISIDEKNKKLIDWCSEYMKKTFGTFNISKAHETVYNVITRSVFLGLFFEKLFGKGFDKKKIFKDCWTWDKTLINELVCGLLCSDGSMGKDTTMYLSMTNPEFIEELYYLLRNYSIDVSISKDRIQKYNGKIYKTLFIPKRTEYIKSLMKTYTDGRIEKALKMLKDKNQKTDPQVKNVNGNIFLRVKNKTQITENLPEYVYTLGVEDDHSYNVEGIIVENCFLLGTDDSLEGIFKTITDCAKISKVGGGIGVHVSNIRSKGSLIRKTNGVSDGIIPMLKVYNDVSTYINQCILPEVIVYSKDGPKMMKDITTDDYLVTLDGTYKKVNQVIVNKKNEEIFEFHNGFSAKPLRCTGEHDIYIMRDEKEPEFIKASEIKEGDLVGFPIIRTSQREQLQIKSMLNDFLTLCETETPHYRIIYLANELDMYKMKQQFLSIGILVKCRITEEYDARFGFVDPAGLFFKKKVTRYVCCIPKNDYTNPTIGYINKTNTPDGSDYNQVIFTPITKITKEHYTGNVYDFNMIDNHNYLTDMGLVHNSGKRKGSFAVYLEPHHPDILEFLELKKNQGHDNVRARDLFYAIWVSDLFMKRVESDSEWALMCPDECPGLSDCYGDEYEQLYNKYYDEKRYKRIVKARDIWEKILDLQIETGVPYIGYKDAVNRKSNHKNIGTIKSSNLCVAPETQILTSTGYQTISLLEDQEVQVWNGESFSTTTVRRTGTGQELIKVVLSNSSELECTPYHKFYVYDETDENDIVMVQASDLVPGQRLIKSDYPIIESTKVSNLDELKNICNGFDSNYTSDIRGSFVDIQCNSLELTKSLKYLINTLGCDPEITCDNNIWTIRLSSYNLLQLYNIGFDPIFMGGLALTIPKTDNVITVNSIVTTGRISDTFCFTEELRGMGIFNGILTGQCMEISLYSDHETYAVCNLMSFALPKYIEYDSDNKPFFNHQKLAEIAEYAIGPMNRVIDHNYYPTPETSKGNFSSRPLGLGTQGLHDCYFKLGIPYDSPEAEKLNKEIFESLYYGCIKGSINEARKDGPYPLYQGSPFSRGKLQFDLAQEFDGIELSNFLSGRWNWDSLKADLKQYGIRNSMLTALMPTASSSVLLNNCESFEPVDSCIFKRRTLIGDSLIVNKYLVNDLEKLGLWSKNMKDLILLHKGSIQKIDGIPQKIKDIYKTCWEISMKSVIRQAADRGVFVDQMQSMNLFMSNPTISKLTSAHFYAWKNNLKTGMYYLRSQSSVQAADFGVDATLEKNLREKNLEEEILACSIDNREDCEMCSS